MEWVPSVLSARQMLCTPLVYSLVVSTGSFSFEFCDARPTLSTTGMGSCPMNMGCYVRVHFFPHLQVLWLEGVCWKLEWVNVMNQIQVVSPRTSDEKKGLSMCWQILLLQGAHLLANRTGFSYGKWVDRQLTVLSELLPMSLSHCAPNLSWWQCALTRYNIQRLAAHAGLALAG